MHRSVREFVTAVLPYEVVAGSRVVEVGAYNVNGSIRPDVELRWPESYLATDLRPGPGVDVAIDAEHLPLHLGQEACDILICLETLEHIERWREALWSMLAVLRIGGLLVLTTRSPGFARHDHPGDHWRWELAGWTRTGIPWRLVHAERDLEAPGILLAIRPTNRITLLELNQIVALPAEAPA